ncbi:autotransporter assembly complex protein TamA [Devosia sp. RR2S18]|uniref:autotransporter assembly complex protein TamA n=1 Tax=Devosia rhizosphaerae TaxID=3049774 RepID=UPI0025421DC2|nr:autotransporter assembly complex family protein [Devosia sp. RR2S18]WIJ26154.1 autotransporter assembly complex family protein [Devosia sp. RR2S18]
MSALCVAATLMTAAPATAFELFGIKFFEDESAVDAVIADPQPYVLDVSVNGVGDVVDAVRNASSLVAGQDEPASGAAGLLATARGDYRRIIAALYDEGYYGGVVSIRVNGVEAATLPPDTNLPDPVPVTLFVEPGPLFRFNRVVLTNTAPPTTDPYDYVEPPSSVGLAAAEIASSSAILRAEQLALEAWRELGYPKASIAGRDVVADHATGTVDVALEINPGPYAAFGPVSVVGTERMNPAFVRQQTGLVVGEEYDPDEIDRAQARIDRLQVFRSARFEAAEDVGADGLLPYDLIVQERRGRRFGVGASYSTVDGLGAEAFHLWRNLFGQAERLRLDARVAGIGYPVDTAEFDYFFGGTFTKPGFLHPDTDLVASIAAERNVYPRYTEISGSARLGLTHFLSDQITVSGGAEYERSRFEDVFGTRDFSIAGVYAGATLDFRDDTVDPTSGWYVQADVEPYYEFNYDNPQARVILEGRTYFGFGDEDPFVIAGKLRGGALLGPDLSQIPPDKLFFAGGGGSVRGYGYRSIGVEDGSGDVTGGRYLLEASVEARARINETFGVVGFLDGGYVAADTFPGLEDLRLGAGVGVRYYTGLGPLRLDIAIPLNKRSGDPDYAIYAGIGQAF